MRDSPLATSTRPRMPVQPLLLAGLGLALVGFLLLPGSLATKLQTLVAGVCAQRPAHSYFMGGVQLPLEARMGGIFAGFLVGVLYLLWANREQAGLLPSAPLQALLLGFVGLMALDGTNALFYDTGWPSLYPPQNPIRLATGLLAVWRWPCWRSPCSVPCSGATGISNPAWQARLNWAGRYACWRWCSLPRCRERRSSCIPSAC